MTKATITKAYDDTEEERLTDAQTVFILSFSKSFEALHSTPDY